MTALIIYDSVFGNTEKVALAMAEALQNGARAVNVNQVPSLNLQDYDLILIGSPTRGFKPTEAITEFLSSVSPAILSSKKLAVFDTRIPLETISNKFFRRIVKAGGYADKGMKKIIEKKSGQVIGAEGFFVLASEGPLADGELDRAARWARSLEIG